METGVSSPAHRRGKAVQATEQCNLPRSRGLSLVLVQRSPPPRPPLRPQGRPLPGRNPDTRPSATRPHPASSSQSPRSAGTSCALPWAGPGSRGRAEQRDRAGVARPRVWHVHTHALWAARAGPGREGLKDAGELSTSGSRETEAGEGSWGQHLSSPPLLSLVTLPEADGESVGGTPGGVRRKPGGTAASTPERRVPSKTWGRAQRQIRARSGHGAKAPKSRERSEVSHETGDCVHAGRRPEGAPDLPPHQECASRRPECRRGAKAEALEDPPATTRLHTQDRASDTARGPSPHRHSWPSASAQASRPPASGPCPSHEHLSHAGP